MSPARAVFSLVMFVFWVSLAIYFAHNLYVGLVVEPAELAKEDARYLAHGCTIDPDGKEYTCPNGLPPDAP